MSHSTTYFCNLSMLWNFHIFLCALCLSVNICSGQHNGSWYRGCFVQTDGSVLSQAEIHANLTVCSKKCMENGSYFIAVQGDTCHCLSRVDNLELDTPETCDLKCAGLEDANLPCGGKAGNAWSIYAASGPFITKVELQKLPQWIEPKIPTTLEAITFFNEFVDVTEEPLIESEWKNTVEFVWQSEFIVVGVNITANSSQERAMCTLTFPNTGKFSIDLKVRNLLSSVQIRFIVTVVVPKPRNIKLLPLIDKFNQPSCISPAKHLGNTSAKKISPSQFHGLWNTSKIDYSPQSVVEVFANTTFALEVSVATGSDLLFVISIGIGSSKQVFQHDRHHDKAECNTPLDCRSVVQGYVFRTTGVFPVTASVSNKFGSVKANLTIVVMDQHIRDVTAVLASPDTSIVLTKQLIVFHLTAVTADRQSTSIVVDFGDGVVKNAAVREKHNVSHASSSIPTLIASYGNSCNLSLKFDHVYETEGVFVPHVIFYNNISSVPFHLKEHITVLNEIAGVQIKCSEFVSVGDSVDLSIKYTSMSVNVTVIWTIFNDDDDSIFVNKTTTSLQTSLTFTRVGIYKIVCVVSNLISSKTATTYIVVQESVGNVSLVCNQGQYIEIEQEVVCTAIAQSGSDINFVWDFQEYSKPSDVTSGNMTSVAKHTFIKPGIYNISVDVQNDLNTAVGQLNYSVYVDIPVGCLSVRTTIPSIPGQPVKIVTAATRGTSLKFYLDVGHKVMISAHDVQVNGDTTIFSVNWVFRGPARHQISAFVYNHISNASRTVDVHVQEPPPEFNIHVVPTPLPNFKTVALKTSKGEFLHRYDLLFHFHFSDGVAHVTQVPVVVWQRKDNKTSPSSHGNLYQNEEGYPTQVGTDWRDSHFHVNVTISNKVGQKSKVLNLANSVSPVEKDDGSRRNKKRRKQMPVLWHDTFVQTDESTSFLLTNTSRDIKALYIDYGDGQKGSVSCLHESCIWDRKFQVPGVFALDVSLNGRRPHSKDQPLRSVLVVEEPIIGLRLLGPTDVGIGCDQEWTADLKLGSHLVFVWSLDGAAGQPTTVNKYIVGFTVPGSHNLQLNVSNDISSAVASLTFTVKHPVVNVSVSALPNILGVSTNITVLIQGGREFTIGCNFGDGQYNTFFSSNLALKKIVQNTSIPSGNARNTVPIYEVVLGHTYQNTGEYNVSVDVANGISSIHRSAWAVVEEAIGSVELFTDTHLLSINNKLVVTAVVSSGKNLQFKWDFSDSTTSTVYSEGNTSTANHTFSIPDRYEISVTVSNHLQKGVTATLPFLVDVVEPISNAVIILSSGYRSLNTTALLPLGNGLYSTQEIKFEARSDGSSVQFTFDFGDGNEAVVNGVVHIALPLTEAYVKHVYTQVGVYNVKVTASNALGNQTAFLQESLYVQIPPEGLVIKATNTCIEFGQTSYFNATLLSGTNVSFTWKLDDQTELVDAGNNIEHLYRRCGKEHIEVTALNRVGSVTAFLVVETVEKLIGLNVSVNSSVIVAGEPVLYSAIVHPPAAETSLVYDWSLTFNHLKSSPNTILRRNNVNFVHTYTQSGRALVQVGAKNCLSYMKSAAAEFHVIAKVRGLSINIVSGSIVSSPVELNAHFFHGDNLIFTWNFGDGSENVTTNDRHISHNYSEIGEYFVRLYAKNQVSQAEVGKRLFVLNKQCEPPEISGYKRELEFLYSEPVRVEIEIHKINCTTSNHVKFKWKVIDSNSTQAVNLLTFWPMKNLLDCPALQLPPQTLPRGRYLVQLMVEMNGTEIPVYSEYEVNITVLETAVVSSIHGGIYRNVGQQSLIHLDGRGSFYPDNSSTTLGYRWTCSPLYYKEIQCFESLDQVPAMNESQLRFPAKLLSSNFSEFDFILSVSRLSDQGTALEGAEWMANSSQIISVQKEEITIDLLLECTQCWQNMVNPDRKVSLRTHCPNCKEGPLVYVWEVEIYEPEDSWSSSIQSVCTTMAGQFALRRLKAGNGINQTTISSTNTVSKANTPFVLFAPRPQNPPEMITDSSQFENQESRANVQTETILSDLTEGKSRNPSSDSIPDVENIEEEINQGTRHNRMPRTDQTLPIQDIASHGKEKTGGDDVAEVPGGRRTHKVDCSPETPDCWLPDTPPSPPPSHLISKPRGRFRLTSEQTLTGLDKESLVISPGVLEQGRAYYVQVKATAPDGSKGLAGVYFKVNRSPEKGKCSLQPLSGIPLKTIFKIACNEWTDEHMPLRYEVSYSLNDSDSPEDRQVIYHGFRYRVLFQLPAGLASNNYQVLVHIAIIDRFGAKTLICRTPIEVIPVTGHSQNRQASELQNEALSLHQQAANSVYDWINHDFFGPLIQVASKLNLHGALGQLENSSPFTRVLIREALIKTLLCIPLRDEVEVFQALRCLVETTDEPNELNGVTLLEAKSLLLDINVQVKSLFSAGATSGWSRALNSQILHLTARAVSNLLTALATNTALFSKTNQQARFYKDITGSVLQVLNSLVQMELQYHSLGEKPLILQNRFISLNASHYSLYNLSPLAMNGVHFQLPASLKSLLTTRHKEQATVDRESVVKDPEMYDYKSNQQCFQARALSFLSNPFAVLSRKVDMVQSELASLDIYNCFGDNLLKVHGLPNEDMISIIIPRNVHQVKNVTFREYYLDKTAMNIHQLNASIAHRYESTEDLVEVSDKYLHIHIQLEPVSEGRTFPVMVIISSYDAPDNLRQHVLKQVYHTDDIKILLQPGSIDGGMHYYIGIVEASFNSGRRHTDEITGRHYTLNTWWGACVYWNHTEDKWHSDGCKVLMPSSADAIHCRCNHLTTFGGYFELIPNDLSSIDVEAFFSLHENPVAIVLVAVSLLVYVVLALILRQADVHDSKKGNCVYLQDNAVTHRQKYEVLMETGCSRDAGTTSKVSIILHGEEGVSETRELISDDNSPMFERESRDRFIVTLPDSLGKIFKIQLWHNNSGSSPGWFLQQVVVRDLNTGQAFYFLCHKWLAVDKDDGKVEREFTAIDGKNISFGMIFWCKGSQYLSDFHTWLSVWTCPPHSHFTRVQRLTVCFTLLMAYMCLSAMWFKQTPSEIRGEFGLLDLSWHNITVGCICCAIVLPLNLMLSFIFRRSRVHYPGYEQGKILLSGKSGCELASEGEDESTQPTVAYSILDQSILNWQNIQDWAQKQWLKRQQSVRSSANSVKTTQASPQLSAPSTTPLVQQTLWADDDSDQASSGFEDATSQVTTERLRVKAASDISSSGKKSKTVDPSDVLYSSRRIFLPFWCRYVAWTLCFLISCTCGAITIWYGLRFGHTRSVMWIQSIYFSCMLCLFIAQPFLILICVVYTAISHRNNPAVFDHYNDGFYGERVTFAGLHKPRSHYHEDDEELQRGVAERSRSRYLRFAGPPQEKQLKSSRKKLIKQKRAMLLLSDSAWFIVMFALLCIMAFGKDLQAPYHLNNALKHAFTEKRMNGTSFSQLKSPSDWYLWSQSVLLDTLFLQTSLRDEAYHMSESLGYVLGHVQIRQLKVRPEPCYSIPFLEPYQNCINGYIMDRQDSLKSHSVYKDREKTINPGIWGDAAWYDSSGYVLQLNHTREAAAEQLKMLEMEKWINIHTWVVFVELTLFNAASNLFSSVTLLLEVTSAGQVFTSSHIMSTYLFRYITVWDNCILGCELLYIVLTMSMFYHQLHQMIIMGKLYFSHFWNYIELLMAFMSLLYMGFHMYRFVLVSEAVEFMRSTFYDEFINLAFITWWDEMLKALTGVILFCVIVKLLCVLRYHQMFWRLQIVFRRCKRELLTAACLYGGLVMAFSSLNAGIFGCVVYSMRSLWSSILATSALSVRALHLRNDKNTISDQSPWIDIVLLFSFTFCHGFMLTYIFTTLSYRLKRTKNCRVLSLSGHQLMALYWDKVLKWAGWRPEASYEQIDSTLPPEFTMAEILYLVEEMLFRMNALLGMSGLPDKRHSFTDSDATANGGDDGISSGSSEDHPAPVTTAIASESTRLEQCVQKIEDKLCSHEPYLAQLLKLDSIGTNILSEEKEQELRSHLEIEIFRQLQVQRQESAMFNDPNNLHMACPRLEPMMSLNLPANQSSGLARPGYFSDDVACTKDGASARPHLHLSAPKYKGDCPLFSKISSELSSTQDSPQDLKTGQETVAVQVKPLLLLPPKRSQSMKVPGKQAGRHHLAEALRSQKQWLDLSTTNEMAREARLRSKYLKTGSSIPKYPKISGKMDHQYAPPTYEKKIRNDTMLRLDAPISKRASLNKDSCPETVGKLREPKLCKLDQGLGYNLTAATQNASSGNSSESEKGHKRTDSSSGQSGLERNDTTRASSRRPELPPKPTFSHVILPPLDSGKSLAGWSPKPRQFAFLPEILNPVGAESSSGSEQEATLSSKRVAQGRRNLRKTKSRGKGKGNEESIASSMVLTADFASSGQSGGSDLDIIIHEVPSDIDPDSHIMPEEYVN